MNWIKEETFCQNVDHVYLCSCVTAHSHGHVLSRLYYEVLKVASNNRSFPDDLFLVSIFSSIEYIQCCHQWTGTYLQFYTPPAPVSSYGFCFLSLVLRDSTPRFVGPSVRRSIRRSNFTFLVFLWFLAPLLLPKWSGDLRYGPCPPARDWGCLVSGLVT